MDTFPPSIQFHPSDRQMSDENTYCVSLNVKMESDTVVPKLSIYYSTISCLFLSLIYVGSLYIWRSEHNRYYRHLFCFNFIFIFFLFHILKIPPLTIKPKTKIKTKFTILMYAAKKKVRKKKEKFFCDPRLVWILLFCAMWAVNPHKLTKFTIFYMFAEIIRRR